MSKHETDKPGPFSYFVVAALVAIAAIFGWTGNRDYEYQQEVGRLHQALLAAQSECGPTMEMSMPVDLDRVQI